MSQQDKPDNAVSRLIRERAMKILRETRAKIDPQLLNAMKEHLTAAMPYVAGAAKADADMPLSSKKTVTKTADMASLPKVAAPAAAAAYRQGQGVVPPKPASFSQELSSVMKKTPVHVDAKPSYPSKKIEELSPEKATEPVDKQKIAQIVLQYMKNREEKSRH